MLKRFADLLRAKPGSAATDATDRRKLATCVLLLEAARADNEFTDEERNAILGLMRARFQLTEAEAQEIIREATAARDESTDLWRFTHAINEGYSQVEKIEIIEEVWRVIYSDGVLDGHEDYLVHKLRQLLNLNHPQLIQAKMKVLDEIRERNNS